MGEIMDKNLSKVKIFPREDIKKIAADHLTIFKRRVTVQGRDKDGQAFPAYSDSYRERLESDFKDESGKRYKGYGGISLTTGGAKIARRQFLLRGLTMKNLAFRKCGTDYYIIGWDGEAAEIVEQNARRRKNPRNIADGIPNSEFDMILSWMGKSIDKQWKKIKNKTIRVG